MNDYYIRYIDLPLSVKGITVMDETGFNNIYINSLLNCEEQQRALNHELNHIEANDFDECKTIEAVEIYRAPLQAKHCITV